MRVECIPSSSKRNVFILTLDGDPWKEIHSSIFGKKPKIEAADVDSFKHLEYRLAKNYVLRCLARKNYSSYEMRKMLNERFVSHDNRDKIIEEMITLGYINDDDWIGAFIRMQIAKRQGPKMIAMKLKGKGVPDEAIEKHLSTQEENTPQSERILRLLETKYSNRDLSDYKERQKVIGSLLRKGFDYEAIKAVFEARP